MVLRNSIIPPRPLSFPTPSGLSRLTHTEELSMHPNRNLSFCCLALVVLVALSGQAFAGSSVTVGLCAGPGIHYLTIQSAVTAVPAGGTVRVCPGTYPEQVSINKNLTLIGVSTGTSDAVVIVPPAGGVLQNTTDVCPALYSAFFTNGAPIAAQVLVTSGPVSISNLTVDGFGNGLPSCSGTVNRERSEEHTSELQSLR